MSLLYDLLTSVFVDPFVEYFFHDLTLGRIVVRLVASVALLAGMYLALLQPAPLSYVGWALAVPAGIYTVYDALTVNHHARS